MLIKCSECGMLVSDKATKCPKCGKMHDFDYPKCPFCKYAYHTQADQS